LSNLLRWLSTPYNELAVGYYQDLVRTRSEWYAYKKVGIVTAPFFHPLIAVLKDAVGADIQIEPFAGGTNRRTYRVFTDSKQWALRVEPAPALSLVRAIDAQARAQAAGVRTPVSVGHGVVPTEDGEYFWSLETLAPGSPFVHNATDMMANQVAITDFAQQLRRLHSVQIDAFGDLPPRPYPVYASFAEWVANKIRRIGPALAIAGQSPDALQAVQQIYLGLADLYTGPPCLCKGDCAGDNLLVDQEGRVSIIDWEWAQGLDPAADLAFWCRATPDPRAHALLLEAYGSDDATLHGRIRAHQAVQAIETIHVYDEHLDAFDERARVSGIRAEWLALQDVLGTIKHG
jgi:aminoglycoside phosphotransferase (APT) family kinase protein